MKKRTCEEKYYRYHLLWSLITCLLTTSIVLVISTLPENEGIFEPMLIIFSIIFIPLISYFSYRYLYFRKLKPTNIQEVVLERVETTLKRHYVRFSFFMDLDGRKTKVETLAIFSTHFMGPNLIDDYSQKKVLVGYDKRLNIAVVLKKTN